MTTLRVLTFTSALVVAAAAWPYAQNQGPQAPARGQTAQPQPGGAAHVRYRLSGV